MTAIVLFTLCVLFVYGIFNLCNHFNINKWFISHIFKFKESRRLFYQTKFKMVV